MQSVSSRIWTRVAVSISYDDKHSRMNWPEKAGIYKKRGGNRDREREGKKDILGKRIWLKKKQAYKCDCYGRLYLEQAENKATIKRVNYKV